MSPLAPILQGFFTDKLIRQRRAGPEHHRGLPRHLPTADRVRLPDNRYRAQHTRFPGHRRRSDHRVPAAPGNRARQHHRHPKRPVGRDPVPVPLRRVARPRTRRPHQPSAGDPTETLRPARSVLPDRRRDRRAAGRARPLHPARSPRPRPAASGVPNRAAGLGTDRPTSRRHRPRRRRARAAATARAAKTEPPR